MTIQTQTPGGQDQPIPVKDAVEAVQWHLEVCAKATPGPWVAFHLGDNPRDIAFSVAARAGYAGVLEYLLDKLRDFQVEGILTLYAEMAVYPAVAPIVAWWRQSRAHGGGK